MKNRYTLCFGLGATIYPMMEIVWRGFSHWSMAIAGGLALCSLYRVEQRWPRMRLRRKCLLGAGCITLIEFAAGCVVNKWLRLNVWDYSHLPGQIAGQICLPFICMWFLLCLPVFGTFKLLRRKGLAL